MHLGAHERAPTRGCRGEMREEWPLRQVVICAGVGVVNVEGLALLSNDALPNSQAGP